MRSTSAVLFAGALLAVAANAPAFSSAAHADEVRKTTQTGARNTGVRKATQTEIENYVAKSADLTKLSNGWSYKSNAKYGYKFSDGGMCVRTQGGSVSCTKIVTDGKKFYTVAPDGTREPFGSKG